MINEENLMKKLAEMSMQYNKNGNNENLSSASSSSMSSSNNANELTKKTGKDQSIFLGSAFKMIERELATSMTADKPDVSRHNGNNRDQPSTEDEMRAELKNFLREHNIKDGNLMDTRRLDLRASQNMASNTKQRVYSKHTAESLFEHIILNDDKDDKWVEMMRKSNSKVKFLNETAESSSEEKSDEEDNDSSLWIERYRKQKLAISKK
jgi:hypothetical protein